MQMLRLPGIYGTFVPSKINQYGNMMAMFFGIHFDETTGLNRTRAACFTYSPDNFPPSLHKRSQVIQPILPTLVGETIKKLLGNVMIFSKLLTSFMLVSQQPLSLVV